MVELLAEVANDGAVEMAASIFERRGDVLQLVQVAYRKDMGDVPGCCVLTMCGQLIDWEDIDTIEHATRKALSALTEDSATLWDLLLALPNRPELLRLCEHYDILDKIVLHDDQSGVRLRLHVFLPGYFDRPHNHRWSYASLILRGEYRHYLFGDAELDAEIDPASLRAPQVRQEHVGNAYALYHTVVHAVVAEPYTVSLVLRGPAVKDRFLVTDRKTGDIWWQYGAAQESADSAARKRMSPQRLHEVTGWLRDWELF